MIGKPTIILAGTLAVAAIVVTFVVVKPLREANNIPQRTQNINSILTPATIRTLQESAEVQAFRICAPMVCDKVTTDADHSSLLMSMDTPTTISEYSVVYRAPNLTPHHAGNLTKWLLDGRTYDVNIATTCFFEPGIAFRYQAGNETVDVLICFSCSELDIVHTSANGSQAAMGKTSWKSFAKSGIPDIIKDIFHFDADLQKLPEIEFASTEAITPPN